MALTKIKGQNFRVFVGPGTTAAAVPEETNCSVQISGSMEDSSTKDTESDYSSETMVSKNWQIQVDNYQATVVALRSLFTQFNSSDPISVGFDQTETTQGTQNRTAANANFARSGSAWLTDLSITANNRATIQVSVTYQGTGPLE